MENKQNVNSTARMLPQETSAAASAFGYDSSREKAILENPQIFLNCNIKKIPLKMVRASAKTI